VKITWIGWTAIIVTLATVLLRFVPGTYHEVGNTAITYGPLIVMFLMTLVGIQVLRTIEDRGAAESRVWMFFVWAAILNLVASIIEILPLFFPNINDLYVVIARILVFLLAYICFTAGLAIANFQFRDLKHVIKPWIPFVIALVGFVVTSFFLFKQLGDGGNRQMLEQITYIIFVVFDFVIFGLGLSIATGTWGGALSSSYGTISEGCILLVIFHIITVFMMINDPGSFTTYHWTRIIYVSAMAMITVGGDIRYSIEQQLKL